MTNPNIPNPGSNEAIALGCSCPILDNGHGLGAYGGTIKNREGCPIFWYDTLCNLHGQQLEVSHAN